MDVALGFIVGEEVVGFKVGEVVGALVGNKEFVGAADGQINLDGRLETVGARVTGRSEGDTVGILVLGVIVGVSVVGEVVMIISRTGLSVGSLVGTAEGTSVGGKGTVGISITSHTSASWMNS